MKFLTLVLFIGVLYLLYLIERLYRLKRKDTVLYEMCNLRREIMTFMRSNTVLNKRITKADYKKLRETLDLINILISKYSNTYPSRYHLNNFKEFFNGFISFVKKTDETKINNFLAENEEIQNFQLSLSKTMIWALLKSIPRVSKIPLVGFLLKNLLIKIVESYNFRSKVMINETINWIFLTVNENSKKMTIKLR